MLRLVAVLLILLALPLRANLGESLADCVKRYGKPLAFTEASSKTPFGTLVFVAGPYQMIIFLSNSVEVGARVTKKDKTDFLPGEIKTIMDSDASTPWTTATSSDPTCQQWDRADKATAIYDKPNKMLIFTSAEMAEVLHEQQAAPSTPTPVAPPHPNVVIAPPAQTQWSAVTSDTNAAPVPPAK